MNSQALEFISIGEVLSPRGTKGHFKVSIITDFPERFNPHSRLYIDHRPFIIENSSLKKGNFVIKLYGIDSSEEALKLKGREVEIHHSQLNSLADGQYYHFQLVGLEVITLEGELVGKLKQVLTSPGNDVYVVEGEKGEVLIPAVEDVIRLVDIKRGHIIIEAIDGLLELNRKKEK